VLLINPEITITQLNTRLPFLMSVYVLTCDCHFQLTYKCVLNGRVSDILTMRDKVIGGWRILHNGKLHNLYSLPSTSILRMMKSRSIRCARHVALIKERRNAYKILVGKPDGMRTLGI
jgi:hypothetical protein